MCGNRPGWTELESQVDSRVRLAADLALDARSMRSLSHLVAAVDFRDSEWRFMHDASLCLW